MQAWSGGLAADLRFTLRSLARARGFSAAVLFTLVLGIGVTTVVYEITDWIIFRASPYPRSEELFYIGVKDRQNLSSYYQAGLYLQAYEDQTDVFSEFAAVEPRTANIVVGGAPVAAHIVNVWSGTFRTLGISPALGRGFLPQEFSAGSDDVVILGDLFWRQHFDGSPDVLGRRIQIDQRDCVVVGVLAQGQQVPPQFESDVYRPLVYRLDPGNVFEPGLSIIGRLRPGATQERALAELSAVRLPPLPAWASAFFADRKPILTNIAQLNRPEVFWVLFAASAFLYAIACLNAMNLVLIRLLGRRREISIRLAVGGSRWQVVRLLAVENLLLGTGALAAVAFAARWLFPALFNLLNGNEAASYTNFWDRRTLLFICGLCALACAVMAAGPALRLLRTDINAGLKEGGPSAGEGRRAGRVRTLLVVLQAAFAVILLTGTGLMVRSFERLHRVDLGFEPAGKVKVWILFPKGYEPKPEERLQLFDRLRARLGSIPGVRAVSYAQDSILEGGFYGTAQLQMADGSYEPVAGNFVSADYLQTAGLVMKEGRWLSGRKGVVEVVVNEALAKGRFGDRDPVGQSIKIQVAGDHPLPIVGVVRNVRETMRSPAGMRFYSPAWEYPPNIDTLVLRLDRDPKPEFAGVVRRAVYQVEPRLIASDIRSIDQQITDTMWAENYAYRILRGLAGIALGLTVVGLFSVIAYSVDSRMTEFGVRLAVGATPADLNRLVVGRGLAAAAAGVALGACGALALTRFMESMLFETTPHDPAVYLAVAALLLAAAIAACWIPARRASRADVARLLKSD